MAEYLSLMSDESADESRDAFSAASMGPSNGRGSASAPSSRRVSREESAAIDLMEAPEESVDAGAALKRSTGSSLRKKLGLKTTAKEKEREKEREKEKEKEKERKDEKEREREREKEKKGEKHLSATSPASRPPAPQSKGQPQAKAVASPRRPPAPKTDAEKADRLKAFWKERKGQMSRQPGARSKKKGETRVFEMPLSVAVERSCLGDGIELPAVVRKCILYLEECALEQEGIYRLSGSMARIKELRAHFDKGEDINLAGETDPNVVSGLLKLFLRELPETVLTNDLAGEFNEIMGWDDEGRVAALRDLMSELPRANETVLGWLLLHLSHITERSETTKMSPNNLAIVFSPTLKLSQDLCSLMVALGPQIVSDDIAQSFAEALKEHKLEDLERIETLDELLRMRDEMDLLRDGLSRIGTRLWDRIEQERDTQAALQHKLDEAAAVLADIAPPSDGRVAPSVPPAEEDELADSPEDVEKMHLMLTELQLWADDLEQQCTAHCRDLHTERERVARLLVAQTAAVQAATAPSSAQGAR